jgi:hypothetical protein
MLEVDALARLCIVNEDRRAGAKNEVFETVIDDPSGDRLRTPGAALFILRLEAEQPDRRAPLRRRRLSLGFLFDAGVS